MTIEQLEQRLEVLERRVNLITSGSNDAENGTRRRNPRRTFGMFANDPLLADVLAAGREYRRQVNEGGLDVDDESK